MLWRLELPTSESYLRLHGDLISATVPRLLTKERGILGMFIAVLTLSRCCPGDITRILGAAMILRSTH